MIFVWLCNKYDLPKNEICWQSLEYPYISDCVLLVCILKTFRKAAPFQTEAKMRAKAENTVTISIRMYCYFFRQMGSGFEASGLAKWYVSKKYMQISVQVDCRVAENRENGNMPFIKLESGNVLFLKSL